MSKFNQLKKINFFNILLFIIGFIVNYSISQIVEVHIGDIAQYICAIILVSTGLFYFNKSNIRIKYFLGGIITFNIFQVLNSVSYYIKPYFNKEVYVIILGLIAILCMIFFSKAKTNIKNFIVALMVAITCQAALSTYSTIKNRLIHPNKWDFLCFYLNGKVAIQGLNFYEPENYIKVFSQLDIPIEIDYEFYRETVEVGLQYFPQSIFLFLPLGLWDFMTAHIVWDLFLILFLIFDIILIFKIFFKDESLIYFLFIVPLFLSFHAVWYSIIFESYTFIMLFIVLLVWREKNENLMGLWLAIGIALKPMMLLLFLYPLLRMKWKVVLFTIFYTVVAIIITIISLNPSIVFSFFTKNTIQNLPNWSYTDNVVQSLLPTILRITNYDFSYSSPLYHPLFIVLGLIISIISFWFIYKLDGSRDELALALVILYTLLIYPSTLNHYILLVLPVVFFLLKSINMNKSFNYIIPVVIVSAYYFMFNIPFATLLILWLFIVYFAFQELKKEQPGLINV